MNTSKAFIFSTAIALTLACGVSAGFAQQASQSNQPSLADAARKARADKKEAPKSTKVFTNDNIYQVKGTINVVGTEPAPAPGAANAAATNPAAAAAATDAKAEAVFRSRFASARRALADDSKELDVLQREFNLKQTQFYSDPNVAMREQYSRSDLNDTQAKIDAKKTDVAKDQQAISDLEDELRKAGGEASWENAPAGNVSASNSPSEDAPTMVPPTASAPQANAPESAPQQGASQENRPQ